MIFINVDIKKIIREEVGDMEWMKEIEPSNIFVRNEKFDDYLLGAMSWLSLMNYSHSRQGDVNLYEEIGEYLVRKGEELGKDIPYPMPLGNGIPGNRAHVFNAIMFFTGLLNEDTLQRMFGEPIDHDEFGEGFTEYDEDDNPINERDYTYSSYIIEINGNLYHIGYDHRGTKIDGERGLRQEDVLLDMVSLVDKYLEHV